MTEPVLGVILAGGRSRRMGGGDKAFRTLGGRTLIGRVLDAMRPQCRDLVISCSADNASLFGDLGVRLLMDEAPGGRGPLGGVLAALEWLAESYSGPAGAVSVAADMPFLPGDLVQRLLCARDAEASMLACAASGNRLHPVCAFWPVALRGDLRDSLRGQTRKVEAYLRAHALGVAEWPIEPFDPFFNVNTPEDFATAEAVRRLRRD